MSTDFHKILLSEGKFYDFRFLQLETATGNKFFTTVIRDFQYIYFRMVFENKQWIISDSHEVPEWILLMEDVFSQNIIQETRE